MANIVAMRADTAEFVAKYAFTFFCNHPESVEVFKKFDLPEHRNILDEAFVFFCRGMPLRPGTRRGGDQSEYKIRKIYLAMYDKVFRELGIRGRAKSLFIERIQTVKRDMPNDVSPTDEAWLNDHLSAVLPECNTCGHMVPGTRYVDYSCNCIGQYLCMTCHTNRVEVARQNDIACQGDFNLARIFVRCPGCNLVDSAGIRVLTVPAVVLGQTIPDEDEEEMEEDEEEVEEEVQEPPAAIRRLNDAPPLEPVIAQEQDPVPDVHAQLAAARREAEDERRERERVQQVAAAEIANRDAALDAQSHILIQNQASQASSSILSDRQRAYAQGNEVLRVRTLDYAIVGQRAQLQQINRGIDTGNIAFQQIQALPISQAEVDEFQRSMAPPQLPVVQTNFAPVRIDLAPELDQGMTMEEIDARMAAMMLL